jgi:tetratricopeptide (TPR) repeat protein
LGDLTLAEKEVRKALGVSQDAHLQSTTASGLNNLGDIEMVKGDFAEARKNYERGLKLFTEAGDQPNIAGTRLSLAKLALEEGKVTDAETLARQAIQEFQAEKLVDNEADARSTLSRCLILQGRPADAQQELESAGRLGVQDRTVRISLAIAAARLKARSGNVKEARQDLDSQLTATKERNLLGLQLEIRLASAEIDVPSHSKSRGEFLAALEHDARNSGYLLVAAKAEHLQTSPSR